MTLYTVCIGGSPQARKRWPARRYLDRRSARRRVARIRSARDLGVETVWIIKE